MARSDAQASSTDPKAACDAHRKIDLASGSLEMFVGCGVGRSRA